jgi:hypothetical protein
MPQKFRPQSPLGCLFCGLPTSKCPGGAPCQRIYRRRHRALAHELDPRTYRKRQLGILWEGLNKDLFRGALRRKPGFHTFKSPVRAGYFTPGVSRDHIGVNMVHFRSLPVSELIDTMGHEMVHQFQREQGLPVEHDKFFNSVALLVGVTPVKTRPNGRAS